jgi:hypothetical protein
MDNFQDVLQECGVEDLGFEGDRFTWRNNNHRVEGYIRERLDRAVANIEWQEMFPNVKIINGDPPSFRSSSTCDRYGARRSEGERRGSHVSF